MKTSFNADVSPGSQFSFWHTLECRLKESLETRLGTEFIVTRILFSPGQGGDRRGDEREGAVHCPNRPHRRQV